MQLTRPLVAFPAALVLALGLGLGLTGCGGDDAEPAISRSDFLDEGNAICAAGSLAVDDVGKSVDPNDRDQVLTAIKDQIVPLVRGQIADLRDLGYPEGDKQTLEDLYADSEEVIGSWESDPTIALDDERMAPINKRMADYGLTECAG